MDWRRGHMIVCVHHQLEIHGDNDEEEVNVGQEGDGADVQEGDGAATPIP
jgi:hypothetical protein